MRSLEIGAISFAIVLAVGCTTEGTGTGDIESPSGVGAEKGSAVQFTWKSDGGSVTKGTIQAMVPGHGPFQGKYMQVTSQADGVGAGPYFSDAWDPGWGAWDGWGPEGGGDEFITNYSGRVLAVLTSENGEHMRCRFQLAEPSAGPEGGGMGECQLNQEVIKDVQLVGK